MIYVGLFLVIFILTGVIILMRVSYKDQEKEKQERLDKYMKDHKKLLKQLEKNTDDRDKINQIIGKIKVSDKVMTNEETINKLHSIDL